MDAQRRPSGGDDPGHQRETLLGRGAGAHHGDHHPLCLVSENHGLFLDLLDTLDRTYPAPLFTHLTVVADNAKIHQAEKVQKWLAAHPRFELLYSADLLPARQSD